MVRGSRISREALKKRFPGTLQRQKEKVLWASSQQLVRVSCAHHFSVLVVVTSHW